MSSLLSALDNNRSEDEDDQINRLFPKCKPRASSLSLSPSLQHMSHYDSTSTTNTTTSSTSELCLNTTRTSSATDFLLLSQSPPPNNTLILLSPNNTPRNNDNTFCRTSAQNKNTFDNAPRRSQQLTNDLHQQKHHYFSSSNDALLKTSSWNNHPSEHSVVVERGLPSFHLEQICNNQTSLCSSSPSSYDNNNVVNKHQSHHNYNNQHQKNSSELQLHSSRCVGSTNLRKSASGTTFPGTESSSIISNSNSLHQSTTTTVASNTTTTTNTSSISSARHKNKCESNSNFGHKNVSRNQSNKGKVSQLHQNHNLNGISQHRIHHHHNHHQQHPQSGPHHPHHHPIGNSGSSSSHSKRDKVRAATTAKDCITKGMECSISSAIEDTFDNGIGSRSSGESSDLMENLVSPTQSLRNTSSTITSPTAASNTAINTSTPTTLRDSRIEIAGGREVYSQNRIRASRRHRGSSSSSSAGHTHNASSSSCNSVSASSQSELMMAESQGIPGGGKVRKKSQAQGMSSHPHSYTQQHHHCCHSSGPHPQPPPPPPCCSVPGEVGVGLPAVIWEPNHPHPACTSGGGSRRSAGQYLPTHSHHCTVGVKSTPHPCGCSCCAGHHSYPQEYSNAPTVPGQPPNTAPLFSPHEFSRGGPPSTSCSSSNSAASQSQMTMRETMFASEVRTVVEKKSEEKNNKGLGGGGGLVHVNNYTKELLKETSSSVVPATSPTATPNPSVDPVIYEAVVGDGKVVFDDIGVVEWKEDDNPVECGYDGGDELAVHHDDLNESVQRKRQIDDGVGECCSISNNASRICSSGGSGGFVPGGGAIQLIEGSPCASNRDGNTTPSGYESDDGSNPNTNSSNIVVNSENTIISKGCNNFGMKRLGSIPIADYEGSPKRYGLKQSSSSHFDVLDEILDGNGGGNGGLLSQDSSSGTSLIDQTIVGAAAGTSSSSSSLDNTNTNVSSNSSSRTNNRISPRALSPASQQHLHQQTPTSRFPGFPQRVSSTSNASSAPYHSHHHHHHHNQQQTQHHHHQSHSNELTGSGGHGGFMGDGKCQREEPCVTVNSTTSISSNYPSSAKANSNGKDREEENGLIKPLPCNSSVEVETNLSSRGDRSGGGGGSGMKTLGGEILVESNSETCPPSSISESVTPTAAASSSTTTTSSSRNQDMLLYEFSETRKVLEEFFNATGDMSLADKATFDELDYTLKRQAGNSYVGQRLAGDVCGESSHPPGPCGSEESPKKPPRRGVLLLSAGTTSDGDEDGSDLEKGSPKLISFQEISLPQQQSQIMHTSSPPHHSSLNQQQQHHNHHHPHHHNHHLQPGRCSGGVQHQLQLQPSSRSPRSVKSHSRSQSQSPPPHDPTRDINDNDIDVETASTNTETDLGDTEVGMQVGHSRNFTLSPETTDCDSNELESELSLDYEASVHSSSRVGVTMPVVEDGLSSGNESENEDIIEVDIGYSHHHHHHLHNHHHHQHHNHHLHHDPSSFYLNNDTKMILNNPFTNSGSGKMENNGGGGLGGLPMENNKGIFKPTNNGNPFFNIEGIPSNLLDWNISGIGNNEDLVIKSNSGSIVGVGGLIEDANNSDSNNESNATVMLMKKQISEIEKEIQLRATAQQQQCQRRVSQSDGGGGVGGLEMDGGVVGDLNNEETNEEINFCVGESHQKNSFRTNGFSTNGNGGVSNPSHKGPLVGGSNCTSKNSSNQVVVVGDCSSGGGRSTGDNSQSSQPPPTSSQAQQPPSSYVPHDPELDALDPMRPTPPPSPAPGSIIRQQTQQQPSQDSGRTGGSFLVPSTSHQPGSLSFDRMGEMSKMSSSSSNSVTCGGSTSPPSVNVTAAIQDIKEAIQRTKPLPLQQRLPPDHLHHQQSTNSSLASSNSVSTSAPSLPPASSQTTHNNSNPRVTHQYQHTLSQERAAPLICDSSPVWIPRHASNSGRMLDHRSSDNSSGVRDPLLKKQRYDDTGDDDADTDQETDRLLGQTRTEDDYGFYDEKDWKKTKSRSLLPAINKGVAFVKSATTSVPSPHLSTSASSLSAVTNNAGSNNNATTNSSSNLLLNHSSTSAVIPSPPNNSSSVSKSLSPANPFDESQVQLPSSAGSSSVASKSNKKEKDGVKKKRSKEDILNNPTVLIEGVLFRARYLGSTQLVCEGQQPTKATRMMQAEEAVSRIKLSTTSSSVNGTPPTSTEQGSSLKGSSTIHPSVVAPLPSSLTQVHDQLSPLPLSSSLPPSKIEDVLEDYAYPEDDESCCEDDESLCEEGDEDILEDTSPHHSSSSLGGLTSSKGTGILRRLPPFENIHGSANALHDDGGGSNSVGGGGGISLHHNRTGGSRGSLSGGGVGGGSCEAFPTGTSAAQSPSFLHIIPPYGSALPGTMFRLRFVGSLEVDEEIGSGKRRRKRPKKTMVEEAVMKMKAPEGETQPSTEVDLFISTEKIMVLNTDLKEIMMDHALRTISYIADIGDLVVLMARRRPVPTDTVDESKPPRPPKMICHVFESDEAQYIAQSIGQAFQVAYMEFLKANGIEDSSFVREMDYQEVLNSQEIFGDELQMFAKKELQKEVVVPKTKGEILGVVIVESGWGSMLPTVVIANLAPSGAAARCGQLNIGDQIIAINGVSLVGLPLSTCQNYIKNTKTQTVVKLTVVPCPPVVEVKIKRPDTKYQLGFSVQNGVICSLLRGGIAERGGVRVGHRIIEINSQSVVAVPHEKIVNLLATSVGEINMKTMPTSMFRLLTGQETPLYI